jgi:prepilin-type processing-associated H-X9-DG protein
MLATSHIASINRRRTANMAIVIRCECGKEFETGDENAGRRGKCPACQRPIIVPQPKPLAESDFAPLHDFGPTRTSGKAIASFILGLCSFILCLITGIPAIILGILGLGDINNPKNNLSGKGLAISGIVMGSLGAVLIIPSMLIALLLPAVQAAREAARRAQCVNNIKQIGLAMFNYESANGCFPPAATYDENGKPLLSWRVLLLPYLDQGPLYAKFRLDEPWDSPNNKPLGDVVVNVFKCPSNPESGALTNYQVFVDPRAMFTGKPAGVTIRDVTDGLANTLLVVEAAHAVPWSKPEDLTLVGVNDAALGTGSKHPGGFNASMADGSVHFIKSSPTNRNSYQLLRGLVTRDGGEIVNVP